MNYHVAYGKVDELEVSAHVHDLNTFLCADSDSHVHVSDDEGNLLTVHKGAVDWYRIQPVDRVTGCDETAHYR